MLKAAGADINNCTDELPLTGAVITMHIIVIGNVYDNNNIKAVCS